MKTNNVLIQVISFSILSTIILATQPVAYSQIGVNASANPNPICLGDCTDLSFTVAGSPPYTVMWSNGGITHVCPTTTTAYTVTVVDGIGHTGSDDVVVTVDSCTAIKENTDLSDFRIFQNPFINNITIIAKDNLVLKNALVTIYDLNGEFILQQALIKENTDIKTHGFAKGVYIFKIDYNLQVFTKKIVLL